MALTYLAISLFSRRKEMGQRIEREGESRERGLLIIAKLFLVPIVLLASVVYMPEESRGMELLYSTWLEGRRR